MIKNLLPSKVIPIVVAVLALVFIVSPRSVLSHNGGEPRIVDVEAGDFRLSVWTLPVPLQTGDLNFIVYAAESSAQGEFVRSTSPVLDANIELIIEPIEGGSPIVIRPNHGEATNNLFYESYFELLEPGEYNAIVSVESNDGRTGEAGFSFVLAKGALDINWFQYSGYALIAVVLGWFVWQIRQEKRFKEV